MVKYSGATTIIIYKTNNSSPSCFKKMIKGFLIIFILISISCTKNKGVNQTVDDLTVFQTDVTGLSSMYRRGQSFISVSDKNGIYEINLEGKTIRKLSYNGNADLEGVAINDMTSDIYVVDEASMNVYQLSADEQSLQLITHINISGGISNKGLEGVAYANDTLYIVNQTQPTLLIKVSLSEKKEVSRTNVSFATYLSDICFDKTDNTLWICDSQSQKLFHCDLNGNVLKSQDISFVQKAEALFVDRQNKVVWIGCDATGKIYKLPLTK